MVRSPNNEEKEGTGLHGADDEGSAEKSAASSAEYRDIHRIGGARVENLRLKPKEAALAIPGISVLKAASAEAAAQQMRAAFRRARILHEAAKTVGSTTEELIRRAGFEIIPVPSSTLPNHYRIVHPEGATGFGDENLARLAQVFVNTTGH